MTIESELRKLNGTMIHLGVGPSGRILKWRRTKTRIAGCQPAIQPTDSRRYGAGCGGYWRIGFFYGDTESGKTRQFLPGGGDPPPPRLRVGKNVVCAGIRHAGRPDPPRFAEIRHQKNMSDRMNRMGSGLTAKGTAHRSLVTRKSTGLRRIASRCSRQVVRIYSDLVTQKSPEKPHLFGFFRKKIHENG